LHTLQAKRIGSSMGIPIQTEGVFMKRPGISKFPHSAALFQFCQKVLCEQKGTKVHDQEVGTLLKFNPSDCSHWKRGEKNVRSVFALSKLADTLQLEHSLVHDLVMGLMGVDEAYYEYKESRRFLPSSLEGQQNPSPENLEFAQQRMVRFVETLLQRADIQAAPLYLPEIFRFFPFVTLQPIEMVDKLSRILRVKPGQYTIQFKKGDLKAQVRMSIAQDLARILFVGERKRFPELGIYNADVAEWEQRIFIAGLLLPKALLLEELGKADIRKNTISELASLFWVPKSLLGFQLQAFCQGKEAKTAEVRHLQLEQSL